MKYCFLDAEFNGVANKDLNVVSIASKQVVDGVVVGESSFWTHGKKYTEASDFYASIASQGYTFVSFVVEAETRTLKTVCPKVDWTTVQWIDLYLEYRCLLNHNHALAYGEQYIKGKVIKTSKPARKWKGAQKVESAIDETRETGSHHQPQYSLAAATFKLLGKIVDTEEKNKMRSVIIGSNAQLIETYRHEILSYNVSDISNLQDLLQKVIEKFQCKGIREEVWLEHALRRGHYAALTAYMISRGYPVNLTKVGRLMSNVGDILKTAKKECNNHGFEAFRWDKKKEDYVRVNKNIKNWILEQGQTNWTQTDKGGLSLSAEAFEEYYSSESLGFAGAFCQLLKTTQSLNGFMPGGKAKFLDFVGTDDRVRPHFGIYGAQSSRSQPSAVSFIPLKSHWMRTMLEPTGKNAIVGIDYSSQEFLIAALISKDTVMRDAYLSGDVYLAFAKAAKIVPEDATKSSHTRERNFCKSCVLGMSYAMGAKGLANKMTLDTGEEITEATAQSYIDLFSKAYSKYTKWKDKVIEEYRDRKKLALPDGWYMWGDNDNWRSTINMPIQGAGAVIMRRAVDLCHKRSIPIIFTLHDALYAEIEYSNLNKMRLFKETMVEAFDDVMKTYGDTVPIRVEGLAWSKHYADFPKKYVDEIELAPAYFDDKCKAGLELFSKYLN